MGRGLSGVSSRRSVERHSSVVVGTEALRGAWRRSLLASPTGQDTTSSAFWLQGSRLFCDLRQPSAVPDLPQLGGLRDLTRDAVARLARQEAFAGRLLPGTSGVEWAHLIDLQPPPAAPDVGRLHVSGGVLVEEGVRRPYTEHWHLLPGDLVPCTGMVLQESDTGRDGVLVRVGPWFAVARGRATPLSGTGDCSLADLVQGARTLAAAQDLVDCEVSAGRILPGSDWVVERSSLPFRVGLRLAPRMARMAASADVLLVTETPWTGESTVRRWNVVSHEGDPP